MIKHEHQAQKEITEDVLNKQKGNILAHMDMLKSKMAINEDLILNSTAMTVSQLTDLHKQQLAMGNYLGWLQNINVSRIIQPLQKIAHAKDPVPTKSLIVAP